MLINGGTEMTIQALRFSLQCRSGTGRLVPCVPDGTVVAYGGDETITTSCVGVSWSSGHAVGPRPNEVVFTPNVPLVIPSGTLHHCSLEFDLRVLGPGRDGAITQVVATGVRRPDGACDNGLRAVAVLTSRFRTTP